MQNNIKAKQDKIRLYNKKYQEDNRDKIKEQKKKYRASNIDKEKERNKKWRKDNSDKTIQFWLEQTFKNTPCMDCKCVFPFICMDFDHLPGEIKTFVISSKGRLLATPAHIIKVNKEIEKCDFVCANCHRIRTKVRRITQC